jgi:hypothetical protein
MSNKSCGIETASLSVVIATLGGRTLSATVEQLNRGTLVPAEILICIPEQESLLVESLTFENVKIIRTSCRGQVAQRAIGFQQVSYEIVLQIDDDMLVDRQCLEHLVHALKVNGPRVAVGPALVFASSGLSCYRELGNRTLTKIYYWIVNGARGRDPGKITMAGTNPGIDPEMVQKDIIEAEWLAGGCVLHNRDNLILNNFYPFDGRAHCEDLFHSYYLRSMGIRLLVCSAARCSIEDATGLCMPLPAYINHMQAEIKARRSFVRLSAKSITRMYLYYAVTLLWNLRNRIRETLNNPRKNES